MMRMLSSVQPAIGTGTPAPRACHVRPLPAKRPRQPAWTCHAPEGAYPGSTSTLRRRRWPTMFCSPSTFRVPRRGLDSLPPCNEHEPGGILSRRAFRQIELRKGSFARLG